jgi:hypothetical protein
MFDELDKQLEEFYLPLRERFVISHNIFQFTKQVFQENGEYKNEHAKVKSDNPNALRIELLEMEKEDQGARSYGQYNLIEFLGYKMRTFLGMKPTSKDLAIELPSVDQRNTKRMKEIIKQHGWPGKSLVGDAVDAAWILVQHADRDVDFQKSCLPLITEAAVKGESYWSHVAYLTDRTLVNQSKKQMYGTQGHWIDSVHAYLPFPIEDEPNVEKRRRQVGLESLSKYLSRVNRLFNYNQNQR